jgi:hypothetical protein
MSKVVAKVLWFSECCRKDRPKQIYRITLKNRIVVTRLLFLKNKIASANAEITANSVGKRFFFWLVQFFINLIPVLLFPIFKKYIPFEIPSIEIFELKEFNLPFNTISDC